MKEKDLSDALREEMRRRYHSASRAAQAMGVSPASVCNWLGGTTPSLASLQKIESYLGEKDNAHTV